MSLWNPFSLDPLGNPITARVPGALRVAQGQATPEQLAACRTVFAKFCGSARLSSAPNPNATGRLPDGTPYRISVVGPVSTMTIWPASRDLDKLRGVGVSARFGEASSLFLLSFIKGQWQVREVKEFYGGSGLWVGFSGCYLTDDTLSQEKSLVSNRRFKSGTADIESLLSDTSVSAGLAYTGGVGEGVGLFTRAGKYALIVPRLTASAEVREARMLPDTVFASTPTVAAAKAELVTTIDAELPPGARLGRSTLKGRAGYSRLRDGSAVLFPAADEMWSGQDLAADYWLAPLPLTHELQINLLADGGYSAQFVARAAAGSEDWLPDKPGSRFTLWKSQLKQHQQYIPGAVVMGSVNFASDGSTVSAPSQWSYRKPQQRHLMLEREHNWERPVYLARRWDEQLIVMRVNASEKHEVTVDRDLKANYQDTSIQPNGIMYFPPSYTPIVYSPEWTRPGAPIYLYGVATFPGSFFTSTDTLDCAYRLVTRHNLTTPWGVLKLVDQDVKFSVKTVNELYGENSQQITLVGHGIFREVRFIDPVLDLMGFLEITAGGYEVKGRVAGTVASTAKFVLQHAGVTLLEFDLPNPTEGYVPFEVDPFAAVRGIQAQDGDLEKSHIPWPLVFPGQYLDQNVIPSEVIPYTATADVGSFQYDYTNDESRMVQSDALSPVAPRPTLSASQNKVSVRAAVDPNSGGGAVVVHDGQAFKGGWAIAPDGARLELAALLTRNGRIPDFIQKLVVSV